MTLISMNSGGKFPKLVTFLTSLRAGAAYPLSHHTMGDKLWVRSL
jgi:hypothetical protein